MKNTYWNGNGRLQAEYNQMVSDLVPVMGNCDTLAGELLRSVSRLAYDFYNNGMGNNTSGAVNFLYEKSAIGYEIYRTIYDYSRGCVYQGGYNGDTLHVAIEKAIEQTVDMIVHNPVLLTIENTEDMFDYEDEEQHFCEQCGDEVESLRCGHICQSCEEMNEYYEEEIC